MVKAPGRMDVVGWLGGVPLLIDVVVASVATTDAAETKTRTMDATRAVRSAERRKLQRYGDTVLAIAIEDSGRIGGGTRRFLKQLAARDAQDQPSVAYRRLLAELQHVVLGATAVMLQGARGAPQTAR